MLLPVSDPALRLLDEYVQKYRPAGPSTSPFLFINADGRPKSGESLRDGIVKAIKRSVGVHMTPHQFRHLAGELILRDNPGAYALVQQVLGHKNLKTTMNFYAADQSRAAGRILDEILSKHLAQTA